MNIWVVKCRENLADGTSGWHWNSYFDGSDGNPAKPFSFGGKDRIRSPIALKLIREEIKAGDIVLCYQQDESAVVGITRMVSGGSEAPKGSGLNAFKILPANAALRIDPPLAVKEMRAKNCNLRCFKRGIRGTIVGVPEKDFEGLLSVLTRLRPMVFVSDWIKAPIENRTTGHNNAFIINSDERSSPGNWRTMLRKGIACTSGPLKYGRMLRKLKTGSRLFLYVNEIGVVAEGIVTNAWSGKKNAPPRVYKNAEREYSVAVRWVRNELEPERVVTAERLRNLGLSEFRLTLFAIRRSLADKITKSLLGRRPTIVIPDDPPTIRKGPIFGNYEENKAVEKAAIRHVTARYKKEGWQVRSVEKDNLGYDLECKKMGKELHVEVKGSSGSSHTFIITANEVNAAQNDPLFTLCLVSQALSRKQLCRKFSGEQMLAQYELSPIQYVARMSTL